MALVRLLWALTAREAFCATAAGSVAAVKTAKPARKIKAQQQCAERRGRHVDPRSNIEISHAAQQQIARKQVDEPPPNVRRR